MKLGNNTKGFLICFAIPMISIFWIGSYFPYDEYTGMKSDGAMVITLLATGSVTFICFKILDKFF